MASSKIHLFKKLAIAAGSPNNYYLNPLENLWKIASNWSAVEHEDVINLTFHMGAFGDPIYLSVKQSKFININVGIDAYKMPDGYADKNGMRNFSIELNANFLKLGIKGDYTKGPESIARMYISKLNAEEIKNNAQRMHVSKLTPEEIKNNTTTRMNVSKPKAEGNKKFYVETFNIL